MQYLCTDLAGGLNDSRLMGMILPSGRIEEYDYSSNQLVLTSITSIGTTATATYIGTNDQMFDSDGNTLTNSGSNAGYTYNAWNEMTSASIEGGASTYYDYNALGQRIGSESSPGMPDAIEYYSTAGQVVETDQVTWTSIGMGSGSVMFVPSVSTFTQDVWGLGYVNDLVEEDNYAVSGFTGSTLTGGEYAIRDANHDVTGTTANAAGGAVTQRMQYDSYGSQMVLNSSYGAISVGPNTLVGFQGGLMDGLTGLVHFDARDYDPVTGRWLEPEPFGSAYVDGVNLERFGDDNPDTFADPSGFDPTSQPTLTENFSDGTTEDPTTISFGGDDKKDYQGSITLGKNRTLTQQLGNRKATAKDLQTVDFARTNGKCDDSVFVCFITRTLSANDGTALPKDFVVMKGDATKPSDPKATHGFAHNYGQTYLDPVFFNSNSGNPIRDLGSGVVRSIASHLVWRDHPGKTFDKNLGTGVTETVTIEGYLVCGGKVGYHFHYSADITTSSYTITAFSGEAATSIKNPAGDWSIGIDKSTDKPVNFSNPIK